MRVFSQLIFVLLLGCKPTAQEVTTSAPESPRTIHFISDDGTANFYLTVNGTDTVQLQINDELEIYNLVRVIAASGEKYQTIDSLFFWTKGSSFMYGKTDSTFFSGKEVLE